jgi:glycine/D-amino acid oxidase-like deaminating enzyme
MKEHAFWLDTVPPSAIRLSTSTEHPAALDGRHPPSAIPDRADVVVVGAGYTGLSAARHLAGAGASVLVLEREHVGWGASSRNGGQVLTGLKLDPATLLSRFGEARARELFDAATASIRGLEALIVEESIACEYARTGHIQLASKPAHFNAFVEEQALLARVFRHQVHVVPRSVQRSEIGSDAYHGVLVDEGSGALNPAKYVEGLASAATRRGATVATGVGVTRVKRQSSRWRVETTGGIVDAREVLFATNGYTSGASPALRRRLVPIGSYIIATEPLSPAQAASILPRGRMAFDSRHVLHYFRLTSDLRLLFGGRAAFSRPTAATGRRAAAILRRDMLAIFPELAATSIEYAWGGNVAFTRDQMPHAGMLGGAYYAAGYCGHGIAMATTLGEQIARRIAGEPATHPLVGDRFPTIPLYAGTPWFLPLVGGYYQVKDWLE